MDAMMRQLLTEPRYKNSLRLEHFAFKVFSDGGEDGMIQEVFHRIGTTTRRFVEFGVGSGNISNTAFLLYQGWSGLWMEANEGRAKYIEDAFAAPIASGLLKFRRALVTKENVDDLISGAGFIGEIDLLSIDIDGNDYHVCEAVKVIAPRLVVIEYNASFPPPFEYVLPYSPMARPDGCCYGGSLTSMTRMLARKNYELVGTDIVGVNAFYVRRDLLANHFAEVGDVRGLYNPPRYGMGIGFPQGHYPPRAWTPSADMTVGPNANIGGKPSNAGCVRADQ